MPERMTRAERIASWKQQMTEAYGSRANAEQTFERCKAWSIGQPKGERDPTFSTDLAKDLAFLMLRTYSWDSNPMVKLPMDVALATAMEHIRKMYDIGEFMHKNPAIVAATQREDV